MNSDSLNSAIVTAIKDSVVPGIDKEKLLQAFGDTEGEALNTQISGLVREAVSMPIDWGIMTLEEGVNDILRRFHERHPELSQEALHEIGRCVGWNLR
jgi:CRP-like cAMP-binding protein